ncbi:LysR family transcriptional regulator [Magnetovibrio sp.]|uniref:LysR family transcriptional regulator n=1 Tax=Magnetovibrio sp. TaxID=2024836 RepID=UPI002F91D139
MLRKYTYLLALARERHFGRAAAACNITQPTLSNAIRNLEENLDVAIVERGQKFQGFTDEGQRVLDHARRMVAEHESFMQSIRETNAGLSGIAKIGVIPSALPSVAHLLGSFSQQHPHVRFTVRSISSRQIQRNLKEFELDVGITYLNNEPLSGVITTPLYEERYFFLTQRSLVNERLSEMPWTHAADHPLCLMTPDMENRRITDTAFDAVGLNVTPAIETNSLINLYTLVRHGPWSSIVTNQLLTLISPDPNLIAVPLTQPTMNHMVGLVHPDRTPPSPIAIALADIASSLRIPDPITDALRR